MGRSEISGINEGWEDAMESSLGGEGLLLETLPAGATGAQEGELDFRRLDAVWI